MNSNWISVYSVSDEFKAQLIQQMLADNEIDSIIINKKDSIYVFMGEVEIHVKQENALRAKTLIIKFIESGESF